MILRRTLFFALLLLSLSFSYAQYQTLGTWDSNGVPNYLEPGLDTLTSDFIGRIKASLPESKNLPATHPEYLANRSNVTLLEEADVFITFVSEGAGYKNVLGFYTYDVNHPPATIADIQATMTIIYPNASLPGSGGNLQAGSKVKLGRFQANTVVGFFLLSDGWRNGNVTNGNWRLFSDAKLNPEADSSKRKHNVLLMDSLTNKIVLGFEDIRRDYGSCDQDFNDCLFYVKANPVDAINIGDFQPLHDPTIKNIDVALSKTVSNEIPLNLENISYTLRVRNNGPVAAINLKVNDKLPAGMTFVSANASQGVYNAETGIWTVGSMAVGVEATLDITVHIDLFHKAYTLGDASSFNVFVLEDINQPSSDTQGKLAVGKNAYLSHYSVGDQLPNSFGTEDVLVVGENLTYGSGAVYSGNVVYGGLTNLPVDSVSYADGTLRQDTVIDFTASEQYLQTLSQTLGTYPTNGETVFEFGKITLTGHNPFLNVFSVDGAVLSAANDFEVIAPNGSVVLVNISGTTVNWQGGHFITGTDVTNVLYNFYQATTLNCVSIDIRGSILAPKADLYFPTGLVTGQVIARNISGTVQFNLSPFSGNIPTHPQIWNSASIRSLDQPDTLASNNTASVEINVGGTQNQGTWQYTGTLPNNNMIWVLTNDPNGNLLAGTTEGGIFRSEDNGATFSDAGQGIEAGYIWTIEDGNQNLLAGTDNGIFIGGDKSTGWTSLGLTGIEVRSIVTGSDGAMYAGTWGEGVMRSTDNGATWEHFNDGIGSTAVQAMVLHNGVLYAGTFGAGLYTRGINDNSWQKASLPSNFVWALSVSEQNAIVAGTYGNGVYVSQDNGNMWQKIELPAEYIYGIQFDKDGNIFVNTWAAGIFGSQDLGATWVPTGLQGFEVSAMHIVPGSSVILAGMGDGTVYQVQNTVLSVDTETGVPERFEVSQNYPNPFNPSTMITFSMPYSGDVSIQVFDVLGREVNVLVNEFRQVGVHHVTFDGSGLASGVYLYRFTVKNVESGNGAGYTEIKKMLLLK